VLAQAYSLSEAGPGLFSTGSSGRELVKSTGSVRSLDRASAVLQDDAGPGPLTLHAGR